MKIMIQTVTLLLATLLFVQCKKSDDPGPAGVDFSCEKSPVTCELTDANGNFAIDLLKQLESEEQEKNIFISPFSISMALGITANGANGQTLAEMRDALRISSLGMSAVNESYRELLDVLPALDPSCKLSLANSIWPQIDYPVLDTFLKINTTYFDSEVIPVDFRLPGIVEQVNAWIENNTNGLIKETLKELPSNVVMLLINAIYFKGTWMVEFDPKLTQPANFFKMDGVTEVDMMHIPAQTFSYFENELFQAIDLPYGDSIFSMSVFLPKAGHQVAEIVTALDKESWDEWTASYEPHDVQLYLPKFKMEYRKEMGRPLSAMGMQLAFSDLADFSNMIQGGGVKVDSVIHKAFVEVNEEGTEAAAVTVVIIGETSAGETKLFRADHPFLFVIRDNKTNSILFMGKLMDPNA